MRNVWFPKWILTCVAVALAPPDGVYLSWEADVFWRFDVITPAELEPLRCTKSYSFFALLT